MTCTTQPVELAAIHGNRSFICHIIDVDKKQKWTYGAVSLNMCAQKLPLEYFVTF